MPDRCTLKIDCDLANQVARRLGGGNRHGELDRHGTAPPDEGLDRVVDLETGERQLDLEPGAAGDLDFQRAEAQPPGGFVEFAGHVNRVIRLLGGVGEKLHQDRITRRGRWRREDRAVDRLYITTGGRPSLSLGRNLGRDRSRRSQRFTSLRDHRRRVLDVDASRFRRKGNALIAVLVPLLLLDRQRLAVPLLRTRVVALLLGDRPQLAIGARRAVLVPLLLLDRQRLAVPLLRTGEVALLLGDDPQLVIGARRAVLVPLLLLDRQRLAVPLLRTREVALLLGDPPQLVIGDRRAVLVPLLLLDRQRLAVPMLRTGEVALLLGDDPQVVIGDRRAVLVPLLLKDRQRLAVPLLRTRKVAPLLGDHP